MITTIMIIYQTHRPRFGGYLGLNTFLVVVDYIWYDVDLYR